MPIRPPGDDDSNSGERPEAPPQSERRVVRQSPGRLPQPSQPATKPKRASVGGMVPLERVVKSGRLPALAGKKKRGSIAKKFRSIVSAGPKADSAESDDFGDSKSIYDDED
jgi:hypothetical protein